LATYSEAESANDILHGKATALVRQGSLDDIQDILEGNQVDYVLTDPPHGPALQYIKLSTLSNSWLKMDLHSENEIIQEKVSKGSPREYAKKLQLAFKHIRGVVTDKAKVHVYFRTKREEDWLDAAGILVGGGFELVRPVFQPRRYSSTKKSRDRGGNNIRTSHPGDWILHLQPEHQASESVLDVEAVEETIIDEAEFVLRERGQPTRLEHVLLHVACKVPAKILQTDPGFMVRTLAKHLGDKFTKEDQAGSAKTLDEFWSLVEADETSKTLDLRVEEAAIRALVGSEAVGSHRLKLYQTIYSRFPGVLMPDHTSIEDILERVAETREGKGNKLYLKDEYIRQEKRQLELILALLRVGLKNDFEVYSSPSAIERIEKSELSAEWHGIVETNPGRVVCADELTFNNSSAALCHVLWCKAGTVHAHFEVEQTGAIDDSTFFRGDQIRQQWPESESVLVVPYRTIDSVSRSLKESGSFWHMVPFYSILFSDDRETLEPLQPEEDLLGASARPLRLRVEHKEDIPDSTGEIVAFKLKLHCPPSVLERVQPGQFLQVEINSSSRRYLAKYSAGDSYTELENSPSRHPEKLEFLRIPLSIHRVYSENFEPRTLKRRSRDFLPLVFWEWMQPGEKKYLDLLIRIVGHGTQTLYSLDKGDTLEAIGPLGKGIVFPSDLENAILISGGVGLASLYPVAHHLRERGYRVILFAGARDKRTLEDESGRVLPDFAEMGVECHVTDEKNDRRFVTDLVTEWLNSAESVQLSGSSRVYSCGPWPMLREVHNIADRWGFLCTVLVDKLMLCGVGACMSCVVRTHDRQSASTDPADQAARMVRSCVEGPAFDSRDIIWD
jgi:dihydroorotate dehydrogenase electron transfer subunit